MSIKYIVTIVALYTSYRSALVKHVVYIWWGTITIEVLEHATSLQNCPWNINSDIVNFSPDNYLQNNVYTKNV